MKRRPATHVWRSDANYNRTSATFGDPFNATTQTVDSSYAISPANEYTQITRDNNGDGLEDTPLDLGDYLPADPRGFSEEFGNP